jgi:hypothetical protein
VFLFANSSKVENSRIVKALEEKGRKSTNSNKNNTQDLLQKG